MGSTVCALENGELAGVVARERGRREDNTIRKLGEARVGNALALSGLVNSVVNKEPGWLWSAGAGKRGGCLSRQETCGAEAKHCSFSIKEELSRV